MNQLQKTIDKATNVLVLVNNPSLIPIVLRDLLDLPENIVELKVIDVSSSKTIPYSEKMDASEDLSHMAELISRSQEDYCKEAKINNIAFDTVITAMYSFEHSYVYAIFNNDTTINTGLTTDLFPMEFPMVELSAVEKHEVTSAEPDGEGTYRTYLYNITNSNFPVLDKIINSLPILNDCLGTGEDALEISPLTIFVNFSTIDTPINMAIIKSNTVENAFLLRYILNSKHHGVKEIGRTLVEYSWGQEEDVVDTAIEILELLL